MGPLQVLERTFMIRFVRWAACREEASGWCGPSGSFSLAGKESQAGWSTRRLMEVGGIQVQDSTVLALDVG